ncbi:MAG: Druantia anti-phage system protein DruA, partial [Myxococcota bacterium]|nr:Druantia anti-phage system protein DruA [Myxococcota bacterium]
MAEFSTEAIALRGDGPADIDKVEEIDELRDDYVREGRASVEDELGYEAAVHVFADVVKQGRDIQLHGGEFRYEAHIEVDAEGGADIRHALKQLRRGQLLVARDTQLKEASVRDFISSMERRQLHGQRFISIFSLMRDGRELAQALRDVRDSTEDLVARADALKHVVDPYVQPIQGEEVCALTGLKLKDIWRYFRHTWTTVYKTTPGRSMMILIRDRAAEHHPVVGIAALSSPAMQIRQRDLWVGWHPECIPGGGDGEEDATMIELSDATFGWLTQIVEDSLGEIYLDDFFEEELLSPKTLEAPRAQLIEALQEEAKVQREKHKRNASRGDHKRSDFEDTVAYWVEQAKTHLYRSKRASALAWLLDARMELARLGDEPTVEDVERWLGTNDGRRVFAKILRKAKADRVGVSLADISICGAVPPYNDILGGKLVCMLLASPEVAAAYRERYEDTSSIIASSIAGAKIKRPADLVLLGTTSLYGISSQYNRVRVPAGEVGLESEEKVTYVELGATEGYGTDQFSAETTDVLGKFITQRDATKQVNAVFGEGTNPRLRKIRGGLDELGLPSDDLLLHGAQRALYAVPLARNFREYLIG